MSDTSLDSDAGTTRAPSSRIWLVGPVLVAAALLGGLGWYRSHAPAPVSTPAAATTDSVSLSGEARRTSGVETQKPRWIERIDRIEAAGVVGLDERHTARPGAVVEGVIEQVNAEPGDRVKAGAVLGTIHSHAVHDAWAGYFKALAERRRFENEVRYARVAEERATRLLADKALSPQEVDRARSDRIAAEQGLAGAHAEEQRSTQELAHYTIEARETGNPEKEDLVAIRAPFAGAIIERQTSQGAAVTPGTPLFVLSDLSMVRVTAEVDEAQVGQIVRGQPVSVQVSAYPGEAFPGTIALIGDMVNPATRRVTIRCDVPNGAQRLKPQMFARVLLSSAKPRRMLVIPERAVQALEGQTIVFAQTSDGNFQRRPIVTGATVDGLTEIANGADEDDVLAIAGAFLIKSEMLKPKSEEP